MSLAAILKPPRRASGGQSGQPPAIIQSPSPNFNGRRQGTTLGVVMHSTNGGGATDKAEFSGTLGWFRNAVSMVSSHIVIAANGTIAECVDPDNRAWHCGELNDAYLGIELAKPAASSHITDEQLRSAAWWLKGMSARYGFPLNASTLPEHRQTSQGRSVGKVDIGGDYSFERLRGFL